MSDRQGRLIALHSGHPAENMAIDQALLESVGVSDRPVLRLYTWSEPTLSIGYFQSIADRRVHDESKGLVCVRRSTGGGAIVHHHELTYSIAVPMDASLAGPRLDLYQRTHLAFVQSLSEFGVRAVPFRSTDRKQPSAAKNRFLCFQRRTDEDLIVSGYKVLGSAQRKTRHAVLQHGSLLLRASRWAPQLPGVCDLGSRSIPIGQFSERWTAALADLLSIEWSKDEISQAEGLRVTEITTQRFSSRDWLYRR